MLILLNLLSIKLNHYETQLVNPLPNAAKGTLENSTITAPKYLGNIWISLQMPLIH